MNNNEINYTHDEYVQHLRVINGVHFTHREVDILACIVSGRGAKMISSFLTISPKIAEAHTRNIMQKLNCSSRENIISFIEKSDKFVILKQHYLCLLKQAEFENALKKVSSLTKNIPTTCYLIYEENQASFVEQLKKDFNQAGLKVVFKVRINSQETTKFLETVKHNEQSYFLYYIPEITNTFQREDDKETSELSILIERNDQYPGSVIFLLEEKEKILKTLQSISWSSVLFYNEKEDYYALFFDILKRFFPTVELQLISSSFGKNQNSINSSPDLLYKASFLDGDEKTKTILQDNFSFPQKINLKNKLLLIGSLGLGLFLLIYIFKQDYISISHQNKLAQTTSLAHSNLIAVNNSIFLNRSALNTQIDKKLEGSSDIKSVALVGVTGSGKTTLAREYARNQQLPVIWEINAESIGSIINSFETLAHTLAVNKEDKSNLNNIQEIGDTKKRTELLMLFIKNHLKAVNGWLLIYDHVHNFADIEEYFPSNSQVWGNGKVIVTSRNSDIDNNSYLNQCILINELSDKEKFDLFTKIMNNQEDQTSLSQQKQIEKFLTEIPPFPLDILIVAKFIKATNMSFVDYIKNINTNPEIFSHELERVLKDSAILCKTRYSIITLSLKKIIEAHPDFIDLLVFISLLDSQNISRELLNSCKDASVVNDFIYNLKKYSLILQEPSSSLLSMLPISIHRSTQGIALPYLISTLKLKNNPTLLTPLSSALEEHTSHAIAHEDIAKMKILVNHAQSFLNHKTLLDTNMVGALTSEVGCIYFYFGDYLQSQKLLHEGLTSLNENTDVNIHRIAKVFTYLGHIHSEFDNHEESINAFKKSLDIYKSDYSKNHFAIAQLLTYLGNTYRAKGDYEKAYNLLNESLDIHKEYPSPNSLDLANTLLHLGRVQRALGRYEETQSLLEQSLAIYQTDLPASYTKIIVVSTHLGKVYRKLGNYIKAKEIHEESLDIHKKLFGDENIRTAWAMAHLGNIYTELTEFTKAKEMLEKSIVIHKTSLAKNDLRISLISSYLGTLYTRLGEYKKAREIFEDTLAIYKKNFGDSHIQTARILQKLGEISLLEGSLETAESLFAKTLEISQQSKHPDSYIFLESMGDLYLKKYKKAIYEGNSLLAKDFKTKANEYFQEALKTVEDYFPKDSPHFKRIQPKIT